MISDLAIRARQDVLRIAATAGHNQRISFYNELNGDYVLNTSADSAATPPALSDAGTLPSAAPEPVPAQPPEDEPKTTADIIRATQSELSRIGCSAGMPDGVAGARTTTALRFYAMLKGWGNALPGEIGTDALLSALEVEAERVCASAWVAANQPMALSGDWKFSMLCDNNLGAEGSAILLVEQSGIVRGAITNQSGQTRTVSGKITPDRFSGQIDGKGDPPLAFDLLLSAYETKMEGNDAFGCHQIYSR